MEMSCRPPLMKLRASLRLPAGATASGSRSYHSMSGCSNSLSLKK